MKEKVLELLQSVQGELSGEEISRRLGVSRAAVWKAIEQLRQEGCEISASTRRGYRLVFAPDTLSRERITALLDGHPWAQNVHVMQEIDSTNNYLKQLAAQGAPDGASAIADRQTAGRGRRGRSFYSPGGLGLYLSVLLRPQAHPAELLHLTAMSAVAASRAVEAVCGVRPGIKWTNDLVFGTRKAAGILTELSVVAETMETDYVIVGIGVNCAHAEFPEELRDIATSLRIETGKAVSRCALAAALLREFSRMEDALLTDREAWLREFSERCITIGKDVRIVRAGEERIAHADGIGPEAELLVTYPDGTTGAVASGEVSVRGMYGYL